LTVLLLMPPAIMGKATGPGTANAAGLLVPSASSGNDFMEPFEGETSMANNNDDRNAVSC
jgi:hypothetical protein